jgi:hypothetical protein
MLISSRQRRAEEHTMKRWADQPTLRALGALLVCGAAGLGCSGPPQGSFGSFGDAAPEHEQPLDPLKPGASVVCGARFSPEGVFDPEIYVVSAMNHKLRQYPDFAAAAGIDLVSDCAGARRFLERYEEYALDHPEFDADEPLAPVSEDEPPAPTDDRSSYGESSKIRFGEDVVNHPIVWIQFPMAEHGDDSWNIDPATQMPVPEDDKIVNRGPGKRRSPSCSGTFINRNWILTSAHCISASAVNLCLQRLTPRDDCKPDWDNYGLWNISGTHSGGRPYRIEQVWARAYVHPNWHGRTPATNPIYCPPGGRCYVSRFGARHDLALLYVPHANDNKLEPRLEENGAKRLSIVPPEPSWTGLRFYGWGDPSMTNPDTSEVTRRLRGSTTSPTIIVHSSLEAIVEARIQTDTDSFPCPGDSGGPLMRTGLSMITNSNTVQTGLEAIIGVQSFGFGKCESDGMHSFYWTRVDLPVNKDFIDESMERWPPITHFSCKRRFLNTLPPGGGEEVAECWGKPCTGVSDTTCVKGVDVCWNSDDAFRNRTFCPACDGLSSGCNCMVGQCLPTK